MLPAELRATSFAQYPPQARALSVAHLPVLQQMPLALLPVILREVITYDWRFPAEQSELKQQLGFLSGLSAAQLARRLAPFAALNLPPGFADTDWVNQPERSIEQLTAMLWATHQIDGYHKAALEYGEQMRQAFAQEPPSLARFSMVVVGQGVSQTSLPLFRQLRPHGALFTAVDPNQGLSTLLNFVNTRAQQHQGQYAHWYIDGGVAERGCGPEQGVTVTSYSRLAPVAVREMDLLSQFVKQSTAAGTANAESIRSFIASLTPEKLGLKGGASSATLRYFETSLMTQGAGTQIFSTTFVQWAARELLRRAQPLTLLARFAPRQRMASMNELLSRDPTTQPKDPAGSLVDADLGAYYTWINQCRLPGAEQSRFLAWFEGHNVVLAIAPTLPRGTQSAAPADMKKILQWMS